MLFKSLAAALALALSASAQNTTAVPRNSTIGPVAAPKPVGGTSNNTSPPPRYVPASQYDYQSFLLAQFQEWHELDLFSYIRARFSDAEFDAQGINAAQRDLISFMADQELGHATLVGNIIAGYPGGAAPRCTYRYYFENVQDAISFSAMSTSWGESGVLGFLASIDSRPIAQLLQQSIATESRQQMIFRQFAGAQPFGGLYFETGISQQMSWSLLSRYIIACPAGTPRINWNINPSLNVINNRNLTAPGIQSAVSNDGVALWTPTVDRVEVQYEQPGLNVSYNSSYITAYGSNVTQANNLTCVYIAQLNATNVPFVRTGNNTGYCTFPNGTVFPNTPGDPIVNSTTFLLLTSESIYVTPFNLSKLDDITVAGPAVVVFG